ncbi:MAG: TlyA family RNA methyltransferase [Alphaproteobacteria bacterium]
MTKIRLDQLLVDRGLALTRSRAQAMVLAGEVFTGEQRLEKPGQPVASDLAVEIRRRTGAWVSRGALKLIAALDHFRLDPEGAVALDVGASTGGFTEVLLARGAARVYAVDVGHGQLHARLRHDPRVVVRERTNARQLSRDHVPEPVDLVVCDASFISLTLVLPPALALARPGAVLVALIKPQFEAGRGEVAKGGVVRDPAVREAVCARIRAWLTEDMGWAVDGIAPSPITGPKGNREFLVVARKPEA